ncbi:hypothetical protein FN846DRAFT_377081 [Sphaerosporella brunnea]|uniref:ZZ-type domain-containing protein n=1 Tax=Sphaerosporella brunnea TaxID=1250544 RepID=A0A5J5F637_9PEZI|nr:hypothetical protein FN846DRAFT_377081 [Sphaerosporella brunnea]
MLGINRPRVECLECRHLPANHHHRQTHLQKTLRPREYPPHHWHPRTADYFCDRCNIDLTHAPRARCVTCSNYDLCLDCLILGETSLRHRLSHSINVITSHIPSTPTSGQPQPGGGGGGGGGPILMSESDHQPTPLLEKILDSIYDYIDTAFPPRSSGLLEPSKLSAFYSHHGVPSSTNLFRLLPNEELALEFSRLGCEYHLTSDSVDAIAARKKPWSQDSIDTTPRSPSLTRRGWIRFFVLEIWRDPDLMHFVLSGALSTGKILNKRKGEPYRLSCPRDALPRSGRGREWDAGGGGGGRRRAGSRPSSRGP